LKHSKKISHAHRQDIERDWIPSDPRDISNRRSRKGCLHRKTDFFPPTPAGCGKGGRSSRKIRDFPSYLMGHPQIALTYFIMDDGMDCNCAKDRYVGSRTVSHLLCARYIDEANQRNRHTANSCDLHYPGQSRSK